MTQALLAVLLIFVLATAIAESHLTRKAIIAMSQSLDNLTAQVATLETSVAAANTEIARLQAAGENAPALDALTARIKTAADSLNAAVAPKA